MKVSRNFMLLSRLPHPRSRSKFLFFLFRKEETIQPKTGATNVASSPYVEKYEMGTGKNRINVRIFKEPPAIPIASNSQEQDEKSN